MVTLETVENVIREYFNLSLSPNDQPEPRDIKYIDIKGARDEIFEWLKLLPSSTPIGEIKKIIRIVIRLAEIEANKNKFFRVDIYHVNIALQTYFTTLNKI
jgi:hypothetical protein